MARSLELGTLGKNPAAFQDFFWKKKSVRAARVLPWGTKGRAVPCAHLT
jgi:hypothetical protein